MKAARRRRVVMTMDSATVDSAGVARLSGLAQRLDADLETVFVEDLDVLRAAELPFLREFRFASMRLENFDQRSLEADLHAMAQRAEQALARQTALRGVPWNFRVWRGSLEQEPLTALEADVLALHRPGRRATRGSSALRREASIAVVYDGSEAADRALATASALAAEARIPVTALLTGDRDELAKLQAQVGAMMTSTPAGLRFEPLPDTTPATLAATAREDASQAVVVAQGSPLLQAGSLRDLLQVLGCPLLLVR